MSDNPPPVKIPTTLMEDAAEAKYWREQKDALYLLWFNQIALIRGDQDIREVTANYQVLVADDIIHGTGTFNVTLPNIVDATHEVTVSSIAGTLTLLGDATIESPTSLTTGQRATVYPAGGQWWHK